MIYNSVADLPLEEQQRSIRAQVLAMSTIALKNSLPRTEEFAQSMGSQEALEHFAKHKQEILEHIAELEKKLDKLGAASVALNTQIASDAQ